MLSHQECRSCFGIELPRCLIEKNKTSFCHGITARSISSVDIVLSRYFFRAAVQRTDFYATV